MEKLTTELWPGKDVEKRLCHETVELERARSCGEQQLDRGWVHQIDVL